jgi:hypothetical protein
MSGLVYLLPALACPAGMGAMMWLMMRANEDPSARPSATAAQPVFAHDQQAELAQLRAEIDRLQGRLPQPLPPVLTQ